MNSKENEDLMATKITTPTYDDLSNVINELKTAIQKYKAECIDRRTNNMMSSTTGKQLSSWDEAIKSIKARLQLIEDHQQDDKDRSDTINKQLSSWDDAIKSIKARLQLIEDLKHDDKDQIDTINKLEELSDRVISLDNAEDGVYASKIIKMLIEAHPSDLFMYIVNQAREAKLDNFSAQAYKATIEDIYSKIDTTLSSLDALKKEHKDNGTGESHDISELKEHIKDLEDMMDRFGQPLPDGHGGYLEPLQSLLPKILDTIKELQDRDSLASDRYVIADDSHDAHNYLTILKTLAKDAVYAKLVASLDDINELKNKITQLQKDYDDLKYRFEHQPTEATIRNDSNDEGTL